jgi:hypothetical protein
MQRGGDETFRSTETTRRETRSGEEDTTIDKKSTEGVALSIPTRSDFESLPSG